MAFPTLTAPTETLNRRATDDHELPADLAPGEFRPRGVTPGCRSISLSSSGHEHAVDPERLTITCAVCEDAERHQAKTGQRPGRVDVSFELSAEDGLAFTQLVSASGLGTGEYLRRIVLDQLEGGPQGRKR
ncbi:MAG: hypothetical protein WB116_05855 [Candidatus Dormiibacterota bacterium]